MLKQFLGECVPPDTPWHLFWNKRPCLDKLRPPLSLQATWLSLFCTSRVVWRWFTKVLRHSSARLSPGMFLGWPWTAHACVTSCHIEHLFPAHVQLGQVNCLPFQPTRKKPTLLRLTRHFWAQDVPSTQLCLLSCDAERKSQAEVKGLPGRASLPCENH